MSTGDLLTTITRAIRAWLGLHVIEAPPTLPERQFSARYWAQIQYTIEGNRLSSDRAKLARSIALGNLHLVVTGALAPDVALQDARDRIAELAR